MNSIHPLYQRLHRAFLSVIPDELWVDLLESGASDTEIQLHFGQRESLEDRLLRLTKEQRRQYAFYTTRLSSRMALWWILILRQHQNSHRKALQTGLTYPLLLVGLSYGMILLLNHVMYPRINTLFPLESELNTPSLAIGLNLLEVIYTGLLCAILLWVFMPARSRLRLMTKHFQHPALSGIRLIIRHRFMTMLIQAMTKGFSIHDFLFILSHGNDYLLRDVAIRVNADLIHGLPLSEALVHMDPHLKHLIVFHDFDHPLDVQLNRYAALQTLRFRSMVKRLRNGLMSCAYVSFGFIMVCAYQMMFEPIRRLEQWL